MESRSLPLDRDLVSVVLPLFSLPIVFVDSRNVPTELERLEVLVDLDLDLERALRSSLSPSPSPSLFLYLPRELLRRELFFSSLVRLLEELRLDSLPL